MQHPMAMTGTFWAGPFLLSPHTTQALTVASVLDGSDTSSSPSPGIPFKTSGLWTPSPDTKKSAKLGKGTSDTE